MLEDRKFFYPVGAKKSPWKAIGDQQAVTMDREHPYAGRPVTQAKASAGAASGIRQAGLALQKGKKYEGRIVLSGSGAAKVEVSLVWGPGQQDRQTRPVEALTADHAPTPLEFTAGSDTSEGRLEIVGRGEGAFRVAAVSLMPGDNVEGMRPDTLQLLRELDSPIYRWPGGNFVSGYEWHHGIGPRDERPPRFDYAWNAVDSNDFGLDEFIVFCRLLKTEPLVVVNSGYGDAYSAAREVEYANAPADSRLGRRRAANGHPEPYGVKYWGVGNEMYGNWQLGHIDLKQYVIKHNLFAEAMRKVDPAIELIAVGDAGPWSEGMLRGSADQMSLLSEHFYCQEKPDLLAHVRQIAGAVRRKADAHRDYRKRLANLEGKDIRIALDEWNYWYGKEEFGPVGPRYFLKDALGIAAGLHEMYRNSDLFFMANYAQTVNVLGAIKTTKTAAGFEPTALPLMLYRKHFGSLPIKVEGKAEPLDIAAALSADRKTLTIAVVNPTQTPHELSLDLKGVDLSGPGRRWRVTGPEPMSFNEPGKAPKVTIDEKPVEKPSPRLSLAPLSIELWSLPVR